MWKKIIFRNNGRDYESKVLQVLEDKIIIRNPFDTSTPIPDDISGELIDQEARYQFVASIDSPRSEELLTIKRPNKIKRVQQREFFRVPVDIPFYIKNKNLRVNLRDLSAGGLSFECNKMKNFDNNEHLEGVLYLDKGKKIEVKGEIIRIQDKKNSKKVVVQFNHLEEKKRNKILQYCFQKQIKLRKK